MLRVFWSTCCPILAWLVHMLGISLYPVSSYLKTYIEVEIPRFCCFLLIFKTEATTLDIKPLTNIHNHGKNENSVIRSKKKLFHITV